MKYKLLVSDSDKFNKIKLLLISRDISKQLEGVREMTSLIKSKWDENDTQICDLLIKADFIEILCEALSTMNTILIVFISLTFESDNNNINHSLIMGIMNILENILVPFLLENNISHLNEDTFLMMRAILSFYYMRINKTKFTFSIYLMNVGFLDLLQTLDNTCKDKHQFLLIRSLIYEILLCLSENLLGKENWNSLLKRGLLKLTCEETYISLKDKDLCEVTVIIIFNYFKLLQCKSIDLEETYLMELSDFILNMEKIPSEPIMKAVWFEFSVAHLNMQCKNNYIQKTVKKLIFFLQRYNIRNVYTHHPAILYWTFSDSNINKEFRKCIMILWLENNDKASQNEIFYCLMASKDACTLFLEIIATSASGSVAKNVMSLLLLFLSKDDSMFINKFAEEAWVILPHILTKLYSTTTYHTLENLTTLLIICSDSIPQNVEIAVLLRISYLLPSIIANYYKKWLNKDMSKITCDTLTCSFKFSATIVEQAMFKKEKRVILIFLNHEQFLVTLESCYSATNDKKLCTSIIELLGHMLQFQLEYTIQSVKTVQLSTEKVIEMIFGDSKMTIAGLRLLALFLKGFISKMPLFIRITPPTAVELRALYIHIHMICTQASDDVCCWCWACLQYLLTISNKMKLQYHLATLPYTQKLLLTCSPESKAWGNMLAFLPVWISSQPSTNRRALNFSSAQKTLSKLSNKFLNQMKNLNEPRIRCILLKVLKIGAIPGYLTSSLKAKLINS